MSLSLTHRITAALLLASVAPLASAAGDAVTVARYTQVSEAALADLDPLAVTATVHFPREAVRTVGDALRYLTQRTGYSVVAGDDASRNLFALPLPESNRAVGPYRVRTLVQVLVGEAYRQCVDPYRRTIAIEADVSGRCANALPAAVAIREESAQ